MRMRCALSVGFLAIGFLLSAARADDSAANPRYTAWAKFNVGSSQTLEGDMTRGQMTIHTKTVATLKEVADDHVTVGIHVEVTVAGQVHSNERRDTISSTGDTATYKDDGTEDVTAAGKTFHCKVLEATGAAPVGPPGTPPSTVKLWISSDVPGGMVKLDANGGMVTMLLTAFDVK